MTTPAKPQTSVHGIRSGRGKRCGCPSCRTNENAYNKRRRILNATGRSITVPATEAATHLRMLLDADNGWEQTAAAAGMSISQVHDLVTGRQKRIGRARAALILTLKPVPPDHIITDATGTRRRIQALFAAGHQRNDIAQAVGCGATFLSDVMNGRHPNVRISTYDAVRNVYVRLSTTTGNSVRNIERARREGWADPAAWHGIDMNDPAAFPDFTGFCGTPRGYQAHRDEGIPTCGPCRESMAPAWRQWRENKRARQELAA